MQYSVVIAKQRYNTPYLRNVIYIPIPMLAVASKSLK